MVYKVLACLIAAFGVELSAQAVSLNGKVSDAAGKAIGGAIVRLPSKQLADTTDTTGAYSLSGGSSALQDARTFPGQGAVTLADGVLGLELHAPRRVRAESFDVRGNLLESLLDETLPAGSHSVRIGPRAPEAGMAVLRVTLGDRSERFLIAPAPGGSAAAGRAGPGAGAGRPAAKAAAAADALEASAVGYRPKTVPLTSLQGRVDITLESEFTGTCTESRAVNVTVRGSGSHGVVVETNADDGIKEGTIYRPSDLAPGRKYPILVWGEGACARNGLDNSASMAEIASHGYFVVADGTPNGTGSRPMNANNLDEMGRPVLAYIAWAIAENRKPCSRYYQSLDTAKIAANGFSCGGLLAMGAAKDPRISTWGLTSSGSFSNNPTLWNAVHTPVLIIEGHQDATGAYTNGLRDYNGIAPLGHPILFMSHRNQGHGGDLWSANGGDFTRIHLAWLNWWLKGDTGAAGKGRLVGAGCTYCTSSNWEVKSANLP